ncbi:hypothetical protein [Aneurinibacillus danicus]|jgi:hypothetical protein|uniref:Uncharacterized protein n=1 Tax=Aneurinibacillus danicus TaxID=267746 RepID=A0A511V8Z0_9BACL|nr:hypothetical protein [Aneurinibacillus danicus]GEN35417.1 hypothetical protein ADA01nite_28770 [Aneurinibacillus danicus]
MVDVLLLEELAKKQGKHYSEGEKTTVINGLCPSCLPKRVPYRILETYYNKEYEMNVHRVKCMDIANCEWETLIPTRRSDNGLENFFHS